jgi:hypothetical protein
MSPGAIEFHDVMIARVPRRSSNCLDLSRGDQGPPVDARAVPIMPLTNHGIAGSPT